MNKKIVMPIALSIVTMALSACGEDDNGIYGPSNSSNEFTVSSFDGSVNAIARINEKYRTGSRTNEIINIVGNYNSQGVNTLDKIVLANNFEGTLENKNIEVKGRTIQRPIYEKNSNRKINLEITYRTLDLSGTKANSYNPSNTIDNRRGILTDLNNYPRISANNVNIAFPAGSVCYVPVVTSESEIFTLNAKNLTSYRNLNDWVRATENRFGNNRNPIRTSSVVGSSNKYDLEQIKFRATNSEPEYLYNGINYNNKIYETGYIKSGTSTPNENSARGVVDCTLVNNVAADFLETEIRRVY